MKEPLLTVRNLKKYFEIKKGYFGRTRGVIKAVDDVSFDIYKGEAFGLVGESGCGKTTVGRTILRAVTPTSGEIILRSDGDHSYNLSVMSRNQLRRVRTQMQMIYQDPYSSLSPRMTIKEIVAEPARINCLIGGKELDERVKNLLLEVGLKPQHMSRYPHAFSGGQRQRIGIARALILSPRFIVADEPVSALDVSVQAQILELLVKLKDEFDLSYLFITHDLSVIKYICDRVGVMYAGKLVELAETEELFKRPSHPYTVALLSAIPNLDPRKKWEVELLEGEVADNVSPPSGCYFHPRCKYASDICQRQAPEFKDNAKGSEIEHFTACHFAGELDLSS